MADYTASKPEVKPLSSTGAQARFWRMFGDAGAAANGVSNWIPVEKLQSMTFLLYSAGADQTTDVSAAVVAIEGAMELDSVDADANSDFATLGTLDNTTRHLTVDDNVRYVRAKMTTAPTPAAQVGLHGFGI